MKPKYIIGIVAALVLVVTAVMSVQSTKIEYMDVAQARQSERTGNVMGAYVKEKGHTYNAELNEFRFTLADTTGAQLPVVLHGAKPNNFEMSVSVVATGKVENGEFHATNVLTKCPSKYESGGESLQM
jgi:cytochrome c-type biogenesis protein CcmE